jgi:hypothetical protein
MGFAGGMGGRGGRTRIMIVGQDIVAIGTRVLLRFSSRRADLMVMAVLYYTADMVRGLPDLRIPVRGGANRPRGDVRGRWCGEWDP